MRFEGLPNYMKSIKSIVLSMFVMSCAVPWEGAQSETAGRTAQDIFFQESAAVSAFSPSFLPDLSADMADLDVRDAQNRPIRGAAAQAELTELFINNLYVLAVWTTPHGLRTLQTSISSFLALFRNAIFNTVIPSFREALRTLAPAKKRFVHNVHNLWITLSVGLLIGFLTTLKVLQLRAQRCLVLRC
jgi:hypothetical protein